MKFRKAFYLILWKHKILFTSFSLEFFVQYWMFLNDFGTQHTIYYKKVPAYLASLCLNNSCLCRNSCLFNNYRRVIHAQLSVRKLYGDNNRSCCLHRLRHRTWCILLLDHLWFRWCVTSGIIDVVLIRIISGPGSLKHKLFLKFKQRMSLVTMVLK